MLACMNLAGLDIAGAQSAVFTTLIAEFARLEIDGRDDLRDHAVIPDKLWKSIGAASLARIGLPMEYGGVGGGFRVLADAAETMTAEGGVMGVTTSWLGRQLVSRLQLLEHGNVTQRDAYLRELAAGRMTACLAISEPGAGAHPKRLRASAERDGDDYVLNGDKAYVTNGPIADLFLVLAITGEVEGRKRFSLFIVPRGTPGLSLNEGIKVDFLHPAPHCGLRLRNVRIPASNMLGAEGDAFDAVSLPMRRAEDALSLATLAGAIRHQIRRLCREIGRRPLDDAVLTELGALAAAPDALSVLAAEASDLLDADADADHVADLFAAGKDWAGIIEGRIHALIGRASIAISPGLAAEGRDIEKSLGIARATHIIHAQRRARALLGPSAS
jgi:acyl-CoA dehydrogenase